MRREVEVSQAIFDLPLRKWFMSAPGFDYGAIHFNRRAATPVGPAAGPHTQLAQNIVLAWLAGGRIIELKTVQTNDRLSIPRPCIHIPNVGYNVEWSQELLVEQSAMEYAKAAYLIAVLVATRGFGALESVPDAGFDTVFDISVGYDLDGVRSEKVSRFLDALEHPEPLYDELREQLTGDLKEFRAVQPANPLSDCVTLSTFHGCPADQIEAITRYLLVERRLHTIIKLNPTLLGFESLRDILHDQLGYTHLELQREAFDKDLHYDDGLAIVRNLRTVALQRDSMIGAKFTNTLVVANEKRFFPTQSDPYMYLSGRPLHVISMNLMQRFREDLGFEFPVSFSAGIDGRNFASAVACGMVPVTTCTDLLRQGGYGRLPAYLRALTREMERHGVTTREAFVLAALGRGAAAATEALASLARPGALKHSDRERLTETATRCPNDLPGVIKEIAVSAGLDGDAAVLQATRVAGRLNGRDIVSRLASDPRYHATANEKTPRRLDSKLALYDCINCDLCIAACPNDAIFVYQATPRNVPTSQLRFVDGWVREDPGEGFGIKESHQLAVVEEACNECSNCEVYCPEQGAPFVVKERVFLNRVDFERCPELDGFCRDERVLHARIGGNTTRLEIGASPGTAHLSGQGLSLEVTWPDLEIKSTKLVESQTTFDTAVLWRMRTVWEGIFCGREPNMVNPEGTDD
jgi:putative selenate reductase